MPSRPRLLWPTESRPICWRHGKQGYHHGRCPYGRQNHGRSAVATVRRDFITAAALWPTESRPISWHPGKKGYNHGRGSYGRQNHGRSAGATVSRDIITAAALMADRITADLLAPVSRAVALVQPSDFFSQSRQHHNTSENVFCGQ